MVDYKFETKSVMLGRKPRVGNNQFKTAMISLFDKNNPHKTGEVPIKTMNFEDVEKVRIRNMNVSYYLEGNDIVINDLKKIDIHVDEKNKKIVLKGDQEQVESR